MGALRQLGVERRTVRVGVAGEPRAITRAIAEGFRSIRRPDGGWIFVDRMRDEGAIARATRFARRGTTGLARWGAP